MISAFCLFAQPACLLKWFICFSWLVDYSLLVC
jgi:hypothetical protein